MATKRLEEQIRFILEIDKEKNIFRQTHITGFTRRENDAEHAWHMAMMVYLLREYADEDFDLAKAMMMALMHDVVEIDAGDAYAYDTQALATQKEKEERAAERIFGLLPDDQREELRALFDEFEQGETAEARFVRAMDNFQPLLLNDDNDGRDWREHGVCRTQVEKRQIRTARASQEIWEHTETLIEKNVRKGNIKDE